MERSVERLQLVWRPEHVIRLDIAIGQGRRQEQEKEQVKEQELRGWCFV